MTKIVFKQVGGKAMLAPWIVSEFPDHRVYYEPFCGSCSVLFRKTPADVEIVSDLNGELITMFKELRDRPEELFALIWGTPWSDANWLTPPADDDALELARQMIAKGVQYYVGASATFSVDAHPDSKRGLTWSKWAQRIMPAAARLRGVMIMQREALDLIPKIGRKPDALIYADPPYVGHERDYKYKIDYPEMAKRLHTCNAKVVVSGFQAEASYFPDWRVVQRTVRRRAGTGSNNRKGDSPTGDNVECLYLNW